MKRLIDANALISKFNIDDMTNVDGNVPMLIARATIENAPTENATMDNEKLYTREELDCIISRIKEEDYQKIKELNQKYRGFRNLLKSISELVCGDE